MGKTVGELIQQLQLEDPASPVGLAMIGDGVFEDHGPVFDLDVINDTVYVLGDLDK
jgi:hypothetical protein